MPAHHHPLAVPPAGARRYHPGHAHKPGEVSSTRFRERNILGGGYAASATRSGAWTGIWCAGERLPNPTHKAGPARAGYTVIPHSSSITGPPPGWPRVRIGWRCLVVVISVSRNRDGTERQVSASD